MPDGCIEHTGARNKEGYGKRWDRNAKRSALAHRLAWMEVHGQIPAGMSVLHRCDNPPCINVEHLFLGTPQDNTQDMISKGRGFWQAELCCEQGQPDGGLCQACITALARAAHPDGQLVLLRLPDGAVARCRVPIMQWSA